MVTLQRATEARRLVELYGIEGAAKEMAVSEDSIRRYIRIPERVQSGGPKILLFDIETAPLKAYVWGIWKQNVNLQLLANDWFIISWAAKWFGDKEVTSSCLTKEEILEEDDKRIMEELWELVNEADVVIAHNGGKFDVPRMNTRFFLNGLKPPIPYQIVDTLKTLKDMRLTSNRLAFVNETLGLPNKMDTGGFELWKSCLSGDEEALEKMAEYNRQDVVALEALYMQIRPWIKGHPNVGLYYDNVLEPMCPSCGSKSLTWGGFYTTHVSKFSSFRCAECGAIGRCRTTALSYEKRKELTTPVVRTQVK